MKLPFRSRVRVDELEEFDEPDEDGFDDLEVRRYGRGPEDQGDRTDSGTRDLRPDRPGVDDPDHHVEPEPGAAAQMRSDVGPEFDFDRGLPLDEAAGVDPPDEAERAEDRVSGIAAVPPPTRPGDRAVSADEFSDEMERLRSEASAEQRSAWAYLGVLGVVFLGLVLFGYVLSDVRGTDVEVGEDGESVAAGQPTQLVFRVEDDVITLEGTLPDEASKAQLLAAVQERYGVENVVDELVVDDSFTLEDGTIRIVGSATFGDERPEDLQEAISSDFGLANRGFEVGFAETVLAPVTAVVTVTEGRVELSGAVPDQQSVDDLTGLAASVWGPENVDAALLTIGSTTWNNGRIRLVGSTVSSDARIDAFIAGVPERIDATVNIETEALVVNDITTQIQEAQAQINALVLANPISFAPLEAEIEPSSDAVLVEVAALLTPLADAPFEVVGHTDTVGDEQENLVLSQDRAKAVVDRLTELGIAPERMSSRGEGETNPISDNDTDEGRAANRRIEFVLVGTSGG